MACGYRTTRISTEHCEEWTILWCKETRQKVWQCINESKQAQGLIQMMVSAITLNCPPTYYSLYNFSSSEQRVCPNSSSIFWLWMMHFPSQVFMPLLFYWHPVGVIQEGERFLKVKLWSCCGGIQWHPHHSLLSIRVRRQPLVKDRFSTEQKLGIKEWCLPYSLFICWSQ